MSETDQGGQAFPGASVHTDGKGNVSSIYYKGITLHQYYAGMALQGMCANSGNYEKGEIADISIRLADEMLKAYKDREEKNEGD